jgi:hypothetical protein
VKKTGTKRFIVYKLVHRSLIEVTDMPDLSPKDQNFIELKIYDPGEVIVLSLRCLIKTKKKEEG